MSNFSYITVPMINKPVYGTFVYVRDKYIKEAKLANCKLKISCPSMACIVTPDEWLREATRIEKIFKDPKHPMILYGNSIEKFGRAV